MRRNIGIVTRGAFAFRAAALLIVLALACSGRKTGDGQFSMPPTPVETAEAAVQQVVDKFEVVGTIEADEAASIVSEIDAAVIELPFEEGSAVKRGRLIAHLDDSQLAAEVARTEALRAQSQVSYDRVKAVVDQGAGSLQNLDDAAAALKVAESNLAMAKARFAKTHIVAPFDGIVGSRRVSVGTFLRMGDKITEMANIDNIRVTFLAPESFLAQLNRGAEVTVSTPAFPDHRVNGKIIAIEPVIDPETRNVRIVARVPNPDQKLKPGMSANIAAVLDVRPNAVTIPSEAVFATGNQSFVFVIQPDSTVAQVGVKLGTRMSDVVEVVGGLEPGAQIVRAGHQKLYQGARVLAVASQNQQPVSDTKP
jgi:membrane fusion protein (multidrug efflux system)